MRTLILLTLLLPLSIQNILNGMEKNSAKLVIGNSRQSQNNTNQAQDTNTTDNTTDYSHIVFEQWTYIPSHAKKNVDELKEEGDVPMNLLKIIKKKVYEKQLVKRFLTLKVQLKQLRV